MSASLPLDIEAALGALPIAGRPGSAPYFVRDVELADVQALAGKPTTIQPSLQSIREAHHQLARLLAHGENQTDAAAMMGYSVGRVHRLSQDPAFADLVSHYKDQRDQKFISMQDRLLRVGKTSLDVLQERLEDEPETIKTSELTELTKVMLDRSGFGPSRTEKVELGVGSATLAAIERIKAEAQPGGSVRQITDADFALLPTRESSCQETSED